MIIGVTGLSRSGKDSFANSLVSGYGFKKITMSDILGEALVKEGKEPTKDNMSLLGDEWRKKWGNEIMMRKVLDEAKKFNKVVITGFRSPEEVKLAKKTRKFILVNVTASPEVRFDRRQANDPQDYEGFFNREQRDIKNKGFDKVLDMADYVIENNFKAKSFLYSHIDRFVRKYHL